MREEVAKRGMYLEGTIRLPRDEADVARFENELATAKQAGVDIVRTVMMEGRRYETFHDDRHVPRAGEQAVHRLSLAAPVAERQSCGSRSRTTKTGGPTSCWRSSSESAANAWACVSIRVTACVLEDPDASRRSRWPRSPSRRTSRTWNVEPQRDGFGLSEVPLGAGFGPGEDDSRVACGAAGDRFNLEMITRNPLSIPCLSDEFWATFAGYPDRDLARAAASPRARLVRDARSAGDKLPKEEQLRLEEANVQESLDFRAEVAGAVGVYHLPVALRGHLECVLATAVVP